MNAEREKRGCLPMLLCGVLAAAILYIPSSGPVLATAFWLRERTGWDGFYAAIWLYFPLLIWGHGNPVQHYIEWWVKLLGTVGPG